jgi:(p)ppGpp synthase/HD superfamily hydrolase
MTTCVTSDTPTISLYASGVFKPGQLPGVEKALAFAIIAHGDQKRKNKYGEPYWTHPLRAAERFARVIRSLTLVGSSFAALLEPHLVEIYQAIILHDVLEDSKTATLSHLTAEFGERVAAMVFAVTDSPSQAREQQKQEQILKVATMSGYAQMVKLADRVDNFLDLIHTQPPSWSKERCVAYFEHSAKLLAALTPIFPELAFEATHYLGSQFYFEATKEWVPLPPAFTSK